MMATVAGCGSRAPHPSPTATVSFPDTSAGRQARWLFGAVLHQPIPDAAITAHFDRAYLATLPAPAPAALNASFVGLQRLQLDSITTSTPDTLVFIVTVNGKTKLSVRIAVDAQGLISLLHLQPAGASPPALPPPSALATTPATSSVAGVRQIPVGVGSPPLKATLTLPAGKGPFAVVVLVSGSGPSDQDETVGPNKPFLDTALGLAAQGIATVRYDKRTRDYPQSFSPRTATPTREYVPDALAAIRLLRHEHAVDPHRIFVLGHSQGGTYAPLIAKGAPEVAGVILLAAGAESIGAAMLRQVRYLATLPGTIGSKAKAELPDLTREVAEIDNPAALEKDKPGTVLLGGLGPAYYLSAFRYNEVATARSIPQPLLLLQGDRDYQATVADDLDVWLKGLAGRKGWPSCSSRGPTTCSSTAPARPRRSSTKSRGTSTRRWSQRSPPGSTRSRPPLCAEQRSAFKGACELAAAGMLEADSLAQVLRRARLSAVPIRREDGMSGESRSLPSRPSLRYLKLEAKRRLSAGEFRALHEAQLAVQVEIGGVQIFATAAAFAELGLASLVLAGSRPDTPMWTLARGWADLDRAVVLETSHRFPAYGITQRITATTVLRLVADGRVGLDDPANDHRIPLHRRGRPPGARAPSR